MTRDREAPKKKVRKTIYTTLHYRVVSRGTSIVFIPATHLGADGKVNKINEYRVFGRDRCANATG